jgi:hypothetical protein
VHAQPCHGEEASSPTSPTLHPLHPCHPLLLPPPLPGGGRIHISYEHRRGAQQAERSELLHRASVSGACPASTRSILAEIYLCHTYSCHEMLRVETPGQGGAAAADRAISEVRGHLPRSCWFGRRGWALLPVWRERGGVLSFQKHRLTRKCACPAVVPWCAGTSRGAARAHARSREGACQR